MKRPHLPRQVHGNFCPGCRTVISDIEVEHQDTDGHLYYIQYPVLSDEDLTKVRADADLGTNGACQGAGAGQATDNAAPAQALRSFRSKIHTNTPAGGYEEFITVATTRPETMLGDTAIAVNPEDPRYGHLVGRYAVLPLVGRIIPIIADKHVDPEFGTGAVKITPAHDPNDFEMGLRHGLDFVSVIDTQGNMTEEAGKYAGLERYECRNKVLEDLEELGYLLKVENHRHSVGHCSRCDSTVEPLISEQWFVKMKPMAEPALEVVRQGKVEFVPERFTKIYEHWMENIRDWCISRQLWWGHRIPAWYCDDCGESIVARTARTSAPSAAARYTKMKMCLTLGSHLHSGPSQPWAGLMTLRISVLLPTDILVTGYDIIFFWVARMIFSSMEFMKQPPFRYVLIHGLVRDALGRKMSKSLGNGIDPLEVIDKYGADALRISLVSGVAMGSDMRFYDEKVEGARNFCNKLWNATRYSLSNLEGWTPPAAAASGSKPKQSELSTMTARWILSRLERTIETVDDALKRFEPGEAIDTIIDFVWNQFCDWYIEFSKESLANPDTREETQLVLWLVLRQSLALLHPFAPFITEELWSYLPKPAGSEDRPITRYRANSRPMLKRKNSSATLSR